MLSLLFYIAFLGFSLAYFVLFSVVFLLTVPVDRRRVVIHGMSRFWAICFFRLAPTWKIEVEGRENIEKGIPYVVVVNHRSMVDIILMYVLPLNFRWVAKKEVYRWPLFGWVLWMHGDITIERGSAPALRKMVKQSSLWLSRGVSVVVFPEGTRSKSDDLGRFKEGAFLIAKNAGAAILPCATYGTGSVFKGWRVNFRNVYRVRILPTVSAEEVRRSDTKTLTSDIYDRISSAYEELKRAK